MKPLTVGRVDVAGVRGCGGAAVAAAIARAGRRVVLVTADLDTARRSAEDVGFLVRGALDDDAEDTGEGEVLLFAASEASPYADVNPDRRAAMSRMATLHHLAHGQPWSVLVVPAAALARKVAPRKELARRADRIVAESRNRPRCAPAVAVGGGAPRACRWWRTRGASRCGGALLARVAALQRDAGARGALRRAGPRHEGVRRRGPDQRRKDAAEVKEPGSLPVREAILDGRHEIARMPAGGSRSSRR